MARLRLRTQLLIASLLLISLLTGALLFVVRHAVRSEIADQVLDRTDASLRAFESVQQQHELELSRTTAILAELPTLKALMTTADAPTIQDASEPFWKLAGSDLFLLANPERKVLGFHVGNPGWTAQVAEGDLNKSLEQGEDSAWWYADGQLYWVFLRPIVAGTEHDERQLGLLAVGYQVDSNVAEQLALVSGSQIALTTDNKVIASTLSPREETQLQNSLDRQNEPVASTREIILGADQYEVASALMRNGPPNPIRCYVLVSLQQTNGFLERLNQTIFILGISALAFAALLLSFLSRTITHPLDNLVAGVRALARGDYSYSVTPEGSSEVAELGDAFSKMRSELLIAQQRSLAAERIAALGRAAGSISHDLRHHLAAVVANAEFLYEAERLKLDRNEIYDEIKMASNQMTDLLDSLRELAREGPAISPIPASLEQTVRRALETVLANPESRNRAISVTALGQTDAVFDPKKIERVFFNLLLNACEATAPGKGLIEIQIISSAESFDIRIVDNGSGVPSSVRATLFDPFVSSGKPNGTGLGLAIVDKIIHDHEGSISVEKTSETGTVFLIKLPRVLRTTAPSVRPVLL
jgi:signal transduction histidine kinase